MKAKTCRALASGAELAGVAACVLFLGVPAVAQETPQHVNPQLATSASVDKNALSGEESREYTSLVDNLQRQLNDAAQEFQRKLKSERPKLQSTLPTFDRNLSALVEAWLYAIDYVKAAQVEKPLFLSEPPQMRAHLQVELKSKKIVRDDVVFSLPLRPRIFH
jgi:hypothetical protein